MKSFVVLEVLIQPNRLVSTYITFRCKESNFSSHHNILFLVEWFDSFLVWLFFAWESSICFSEDTTLFGIFQNYRERYLCMFNQEEILHWNSIIFLWKRNEGIKWEIRKQKSFVRKRDSAKRISCVSIYFIDMLDLNYRIMEWSDPDPQKKE